MPVFAQLGEWGLRHRPTTKRLRVRAELLADGVRSCGVTSWPSCGPSISANRRRNGTVRASWNAWPRPAPPRSDVPWFCPPVLNDTGQCTPPIGVTAGHLVDNPWITAAGGTVPNAAPGHRGLRAARDALVDGPEQPFRRGGRQRLHRLPEQPR